MCLLWRTIYLLAQIDIPIWDVEWWVLAQYGEHRVQCFAWKKSGAVRDCCVRGLWLPRLEDAAVRRAPQKKQHGETDSI